MRSTRRFFGPCRRTPSMVARESWKDFPETRLRALNPSTGVGVAQTFLSVGSGDFPVASPHGDRGRFGFTDTGQECPVNPRTGMSALRGSWGEVRAINDRSFVIHGFVRK